MDEDGVYLLRDWCTPPDAHYPPHDCLNTTGNGGEISEINKKREKIRAFTTEGYFSPVLVSDRSALSPFSDPTMSSFRWWRK